MKTNSELLRFGVPVGVVLFVLGSVAQATTFSLKAVKHNPVCTFGLIGKPCLVDSDCNDGPEPGVCGADVTPTNALTVRVGDIIVTEVYISDWSPQGEGARVYQVKIDRYSFFNEGDGGVVPVGWDRPLECFPCFDSQDCPAEWPNCIGDFCSGLDHDPFTAAFIDTDRDNWIFNDVPISGIISAISNCDYRYGASIISPPGSIYEPPPKYAATLILEVLPGSRGMFTIYFWPEETFVHDEFRRDLLPYSLEPLVLTICGDGICDVGEDCNNCFEDCPPPCGDGVCGCGERCSTCSADCSPTCGDGVCECGENDANCPEDCISGKNRYISFVPGEPGQQTALRVTFVQLPPPFEDFQGQSMWVGTSQTISEDSGSTGDTPSPTFIGAELRCDPVYFGWGTLGLIHVYGDAIVPDAQYEVQAIAEGYDEGNEVSYSPALTMTTSTWGDVGGDCSVTPCPGPDGDVDFDDIVAVVDKFRGLPGALIKARADLAPGLPDRRVDFSDIPAVVDGFRGLPYPYTPSLDPCGP